MGLSELTKGGITIASLNAQVIARNSPSPIAGINKEIALPHQLWLPLY